MEMINLTKRRAEATQELAAAGSSSDEGSTRVVRSSDSKLTIALVVMSLAFGALLGAVAVWRIMVQVLPSNHPPPDYHASPK